MYEVSSFGLVLLLLWYKYFIINATEITQQHAYLLLEKHKSASCSLQNLEKIWPAIIYSSKDDIQKWGPGDEGSLKLQYGATWTTTATSLPAWMVQEWLSKGVFSTGVAPLSHSASRRGKQDGCPRHGTAQLPILGGNGVAA